MTKRRCMDDYSILDRSTSLPTHRTDAPAAEASHSSGTGISAQVVAASARAVASAAAPGASHASLRYPGEDGGRSLAAMAQFDLDAALQLLTERAQYITGASGAAIALRRDGHSDMRCHASAGSNAPELGALLSAESGLSGESVRTRQPLRCDDAETDPRVNRQGCRELGIASVVVMPIVSEDQVLGVFELFSGVARAFDERDLSALQRLGEMVETAVKHAQAATTRVVDEIASGADLHGAVLSSAVLSADDPSLDLAPTISAVPLESPIESAVASTPGSEAEPTPSPAAESLIGSQPATESASAPAATNAVPDTTIADQDQPSSRGLYSRAAQLMNASAKGALLWSNPDAANSSVRAPAPIPDPIPVPAALRSVHRCQACGFPVSEGRVFCVECEEKKWRGEPVPRPSGVVEPPRPATSSFSTNVSSVGTPSTVLPTSESFAQTVASPIIEQFAVETGAVDAQASAKPPATIKVATTTEQVTDRTYTAEFSLSAGIEPSQSWLVANKYIVAAVAAIAIVIAVIAWMH